MALPAALPDELRARTPLAGRGRPAGAARAVGPATGRAAARSTARRRRASTSTRTAFHCFGCGAHGDAISFVMQIEGAGFMEAVERLAAEAGLEVPKPSPERPRPSGRRLDLHAVLEAAQAALPAAAVRRRARPALAYLRGRGLSDDTIAPLRPRLARRGPRRAGRRAGARRASTAGAAGRGRADAARRRKAAGASSCSSIA